MSPNTAETEEHVLTEESPLRFACHENLPCFTQCCRDVNIYLTPYDVLRLRRSLQMGSAEFLRNYTRSFLAKVTSIPVVQLAMDPQNLYCKLVRDEGCSVYEDRPWACRMFPLDLASEEGKYTLIAGRDRCLGLGEGKEQTVGEWLESQGVNPYLEMDLVFRSVMPPGFTPEKNLGAGLGKVLFLAYDLDRFAAMLDDPHFRSVYDIDEDTLRTLRENDEEMLKMAFRYIRVQLEELMDFT
jgi:hypothetical protein